MYVVLVYDVSQQENGSSVGRGFLRFVKVFNAYPEFCF